jgi:hypothetical protein
VIVGPVATLTRPAALKSLTAGDDSTNHRAKKRSRRALRTADSWGIFLDKRKTATFYRLPVAMSSADGRWVSRDELPDAQRQHVQQILIVERFAQEGNGASLQRLFADLPAGVGCDENDREVSAFGIKLLLQIPSAQSRQTQVENETGGRRLRGSPQELPPNQNSDLNQTGNQDLKRDKNQNQKPIQNGTSRAKLV